MTDSMFPAVEAQTAPGELLTYYKAIEQASADMLAAARAGDWNQVMKLEGACVLLISQLRTAAASAELDAEAARAKSRIMQRILVNDAEIRNLTEPWFTEVDRVMSGRPKVLH
jgi:flagellar protein FliT